MSAYEKVSKLGKEEFGLQVKFKEDSLFMKVLGLILFFNPKFMTNYTTTIGKTVYFPTKQWLQNNEDSAAHVLAHELVHIGDSIQATPFVFSYGYLFPQSFALMSLFALFSTNWWLLCILFLAPLPSPARTHWELRGYAMTDATYFKSLGMFSDMDWLAGQFTSASYYFMWPFDSDIRDKIEENRELIKAGKLSSKIDFADKIIACF